MLTLLRASSRHTGGAVPLLGHCSAAVEIYLVDTTWDPTGMETSWSLSAEEQLRASRFRSKRARRQYVVTRQVLRELLSERLGWAADEVPIIEDGLARPYIVDGPTFSVSHTEGRSLIAITASGNVGADIESLSRDMSSSVLMRALTTSERREIGRVPSASRRRTLFKVWTRKEALLKGVGSGLWIDPTTLKIGITPDEAYSGTSQVRLQERSWTVSDLNLGDEWVAAVALAS